MQVQALLRMERQVLDVLEFRINSPTPYTFLRFFRHINPLQPAASALASYLIVSRLLIVCERCPDRRPPAMEISEDDKVADTS
jgi:hypothetical protein